jgi:hypothetical protein
MFRKFCILATITAYSFAVAQAGQWQNRLLNPIETGSFPGIAGWMVDSLAARESAEKPQLGRVAVEIHGQAKQAGAKVDVPLYKQPIESAQQLALWVHTSTTSNVASVGIQVVDGKGEWLLETVDLKETGWEQIKIDPAAGHLRQAYPQKDHNGKLDFPIRALHLVWFTKEIGPTSLTFDALTAKTDAGNQTGTSVQLLSGDTIDAGDHLPIKFLVENWDRRPQRVSVRYSLQLNPSFQEPPIADPKLGFDHAIDAKSNVVANGKDWGDSKLTDGDEFSSFELPWGSNAKEAVATIDLGQPRRVSAVRWLAGDANWVFKADVSTSMDGKNFKPVAGAQGVDLHQKWGGPYDVPWKEPVEAKFVRLRFHKDGETISALRLPSSVMIFDGVENDDTTIRDVGEPIASGEAEATAVANDFFEFQVGNSPALSPGAYLLRTEVTLDGKHESRWSHVLVLPTDEATSQLCRRFGINGSSPDPAIAKSMRRAGFGYIRFENAKWMMYMPTADHVAFDGSVAPWHVNHEQIFSNYTTSGIHVLPYVFQVPAWAQNAPPGAKNPENYPPKNAADYGEAIFQLAARFGQAKVDKSLLKSADKKSGLGLIHAVELWNEPNLNDPGWGPFVGTLDHYFEVMRAGAEGARRADPTLPITSAGFAGVDLEVVGRLTEYQYADGKKPLDFVDIINVHFYSGREEPETAGWDPNVERNGPSGNNRTYPAELEDLVAWRDEHKPKAEIWLTEIGNDVGGPMGRTERHQAAKLPRGMMLSLAHGIDKAFIYRETGSTPSMHAGAGLLRDDGTIRPVWLTVATMIRQLQGFEGKALRLFPDDPNVWAFLWQDGDRRLITAWTLGDEKTFAADLGKANVTNAFGHTTEMMQTSKVTLGYFPVYISLPSATPALDALVKEATDSQSRRDATRAALAKLKLQLFDFGSAEHRGMLKGYGLPRRFTAVDKRTLWSAEAGYGFDKEAIGDEDARWISDLLERDGVRVAPDTAFRIQLPAGSHRLRVRATPIDNSKPLVVLAKSGDATTKKTIDSSTPIAEMILEGGKEPIEIRLSEYGILRWCTVMPRDAETGD